MRAPHGTGSSSRHPNRTRIILSNPLVFVQRPIAILIIAVFSFFD
jgi:hypothetical protein